MKTSKLRIQLIPPKPLLAEEGIKGRSGFTLIEVAIVLIVLGILLTIGISLIGPLTKQAKVIDSREAVKAAKAALLGYAVKYGYLPTGADPLGAAGARKMDAWGRDLSYAADSTLILTSTNACNRTSTDRTIFECTNTACTTANTKSNIAFIVYSTGEDAEGTGTTTQPTGGPACPSGTCYWIREQASSYTVGPTTYYYDDIVQYVTLDEIRSARNCSFYITTSSLPDANVGTTYNVTLQASGGQTPYTSWATGQAQGSCAAGSVRLVALDIGICLNTSTGVISGTPTSAGYGLNNLTVTLTDANNVTTSKAFTLNVINSLAITNQRLPDAKTGVSYSVTLTGTGGNTPYTFTTGQAQGSCAAGSVRLAASDIGICLNTSSGVISGALPTTAGSYSFTVTLTDGNSKTVTQPFTLNVIDRCALTGINILNSTGAKRYFKRNISGCPLGASSCSGAWATNTNLNAQANAAGGIQPSDTYCFYSAASCATACTGYPSMTYTQAMALDVNKNCQILINATGFTCNGADN